MNDCTTAFSWSALGMGFALGALTMILLVVLACAWSDRANGDES
jgi:hypothetical protein